MKSIWSAAKRLLRGSGNRSESRVPREEDLRDRLDERTRVERQKKEDLDKIGRQIEGLQSAVGSLKSSLAQLQKKLSRSKAKQIEILDRQEEVTKQMRRLSATLSQREDDLSQIEEIKETMRSMTNYLALLVLIAGTIGGLVAQILWSLVGLIL
jgi:chromosome segregation ATPase